MATSKRLRVRATTGVAPSAYGGNIYLRIHAPGAARTLESERFLAAATYRVAAEVEERIGAASTCAVCVDAHEGLIHFEFATSSTPAEEQCVRAVLDAITALTNR
jgi:bacterioferritin-associated ferredoxin